MYLTDEYREIGQENFFAAVGADVPGFENRPRLEQYIAKRIADKKGQKRDYFTPAMDYFHYGPIAEPLRVGVVGTGDEGNILLGAINPNFISVKAIADIRPYNQWRAFHGDNANAKIKKLRRGLIDVYDYVTESRARKDIKVYKSYQELIDNAKDDGIEAIIIALPLHLHDDAAIYAMKKGLHVLTEKLMARTVMQCKQMWRAAKQLKKHLATGHQRHYNALYSNCVDLIRSGSLGDLHYIRAQWHRANKPGKDSWQQPMPYDVKPSDPQSHVIADRVDANHASFVKLWNSLKGKIAKEYADLQRSGQQQALLDTYLKDHPNLNIADVTPKELNLDEPPSLETLIKWRIVFPRLRNTLDSLTQKRVLFDQYEHQLMDGDPNLLNPTKYDYESFTTDGYNVPPLEELIRWRLWRRTGGGLMAELGSHQLDAASIFVAAASESGKKQMPISIDARSSRILFGNDRQVADHISCIFDFPADGYWKNDSHTELLDPDRKICMLYSTINGNGYGAYGEEVFGMNGTLWIERELTGMLWDRASTDKKTRISATSQGPRVVADDAGDPASSMVGEMALYETGRGYQQELEHWAWCVRNNPTPDYANENEAHAENLPRCHPKVAMADAVIALTTNISAEKGIRVDFKKEWFDADSDATPETDPEVGGKKA